MPRRGLDRGQGLQPMLLAPPPLPVPLLLFGCLALRFLRRCELCIGLRCEGCCCGSSRANAADLAHPWLLLWLWLRGK